MLLTEERAASWAEVALANSTREFPRVEIVWFSGPEDRAVSPRLSHPSFYGSFDWHSAVEMHWVMARLMRLGLAGSEAARLSARLDEHLSPDRIETEAANLPRGECPYGLAWLLALAAEIAEMDHEQAGRWNEALDPLVAAATKVLAAWLDRSAYPVRSGLHSNSAFSASLMLRYAKTHDTDLAGRIESAALRWFLEDRECPVSYEPSGTDFLSPSLCEAELMSQLLEGGTFANWFGAFLPMEAGLPANLAQPADPGEIPDGLTGHLHGLNLSRAWALERLAAAFGPDDPRTAELRRGARRNASSSIDLVTGNDYMLGHWLVAYGLLYTSEGG